MPQPVPGRDDLKQWLFGDYIALAVERDPFVDNDADIDGASAAFVQSLQQFQMGGKDADPAADKFDRRALIDIDLPADPAQKRRGEQARNRAADDDGAAIEAGRRESALHG